MTLDANRNAFDSAEAVSFYSWRTELTPCERHMLERYVAQGATILDLGVGTGRTTPYLSSLAASYIGIDSAPRMIAQCRSTYPKLAFRVGDAADLSFLPDGHFDVIVFSFNGLGFLGSDERRSACLIECRRVLKPNGVFVFSLHNPRSVIYAPSLAGLTIKRRVRYVSRIPIHSLRRMYHFGRTQAFRRGRGYVMEPVHGGLSVYMSTPRFVCEELTRTGFYVDLILGSEYPLPKMQYSTPWYYYAAMKRA